ncbi:radical SAM protein [Bradyrhizobium elkanii]
MTDYINTASTDADATRNAFALNDVTDVLWTLTARCNLRCAYCGVVEKACDLDQSMSFDSLNEVETDRVLSQLRKLPRLDSMVLSGGEALLAKNFATVLTKTRDFASTRYVITNGTVTRHGDLLVEERPRMMITIDSTRESINALTRGPMALAKSVRTLDHFLAAKLFTVVIMVATVRNIEDIPHTIRELYARGASNFLIQQLHCPSSGSREMFLRLSPTHAQLSALTNAVDHIRSEFSDIQIDDNEVCFFTRRAAKIAEKCDKQREYLPHYMFACGAGFNFFAIKANADIVPCNAFLDSTAGNLLQQDIEDILKNSPVMKGLRNLRLYRVDRIPGCQDCSLSPLCDGCCRADVYNLTGEIGNQHPACPHNPFNA